jgi:hypothetical protein
MRFKGFTAGRATALIKDNKLNPPRLKKGQRILPARGREHVMPFACQQELGRGQGFLLIINDKDVVA